MWRSPRVALIAPALLLLAVLVTFSGTLDNGFVWDDRPFIIDNPALELENVPTFFASGDAVGTGTVNPYYRPLTTAVFAIGATFWDDDPRFFHAVSVALHGAVCVLLWLVVSRLTGSPAPSFAAALLFAVHPAHSEPVAYISARADLLCAFFLLLSLLLHLREPDGSPPRRAAAPAFLYFLALLSKITAGPVPAVYALHLASKGRLKAEWKRLVPYGVAAAAYLLMRSGADTLDKWYEDTLLIRLATAGPNLLAYFRNSLLPTDLKILYVLPLRRSLAEPHVLLSWVAVAAVAAGVLLLARRGRAGCALGLSWFLATLAPVSGAVMLLHPSFIADRYLYIPLLGLAIAAGSAAARIAPPQGGLRRGAAVVLASVLLAAPLAASTVSRVEAWRDPVSLWTEAAKGAPENPFVLRRLGAALKRAGLAEQAEPILLRAAALDDTSPMVYVHLASLAALRGASADAERHAWRAFSLGPSNPAALNALGVALARRGAAEDARTLFMAALEIRPGFHLARANLENLDRRAGADRGGGRAVD
jgi:tetratricopeptide (TPR) repeat protein